MLPISRASVWYADGSVFHIPRDGTWAQAPAFGLVCVVHYRTEGRTLYRDVDSGGNDGVFYAQGEGGVKMGVWMDGDECLRIHRAARDSEPPRFLPEMNDG